MLLGSWCSKAIDLCISWFSIQNYYGPHPFTDKYLCSPSSLGTSLRVWNKIDIASLEFVLNKLDSFLTLVSISAYGGGMLSEQVHLWVSLTKHDLVHSLPPRQRPAPLYTERYWAIACAPLQLLRQSDDSLLQNHPGIVSLSKAMKNPRPPCWEGGDLVYMTTHLEVRFVCPSKLGSDFFWLRYISSTGKVVTT